jgi:hypothetical protein
VSKEYDWSLATEPVFKSSGTSGSVDPVVLVLVADEGRQYGIAEQLTARFSITDGSSDR